MANHRKVTEEQVHAHVRKNPGQTAQAIRAALKCAPERLGYVLRKLRDSKHLKGKGQTRGMSYTATAKKFQ